jgi:hypothetical protein
MKSTSHRLVLMRKFEVGYRAPNCSTRASSYLSANAVGTVTLIRRAAGPSETLDAVARGRTLLVDPAAPHAPDQ